MAKWSSYQLAIFDAYQNTTNNLLIGAVAGSGKTTVLKEIINRTAQQIRMTYLAFNREIKTSMEQKVSRTGLTISTMHSLGMRSLIRHFGRRLEVKDNKIWMFATELNKTTWNIKSRKDFAKAVLRAKPLVDLYRLTLCTTVTQLAEKALELGKDFSADDLTRALQLVESYQRYNRNPEVVDFTDMIYIPATNPNIQLADPAKIVLVDECQDLSPCQHKLFDRLIEQNSARWIAVGDPYQAIYAFAGASSESFNLFKTKDSVVELPLSVCYRCPKVVINYSNDVYPILEYFEGNPEGELRHGSIDEIEGNDMVLCRNLKPLIYVYFFLLKKKVKAKIRGKDLGMNLIKLIQPYVPCSTHRLRVELAKQLDNKKAELIELGVQHPLMHPSYEKLSEKVQVIHIVSQQYNNTNQLIDFFMQVFSDDDKEGVILSTIHRAKGLENKTIFILNPHLIPSRYATTPEQLKQESNLLYVARTRAQQKLIICKI